MTRSLTNTALSRPQREYVTGSPEILRAGFRIRKHGAGERAIVGADAGGGRWVVGVDTYGVGGPVGIFVIADHLGERELRG